MNFSNVDKKLIWNWLYWGSFLEVYYQMKEEPCGYSLLTSFEQAKLDQEDEQYLKIKCRKCLHFELKCRHFLCTPLSFITNWEKCIMRLKYSNYVVLRNLHRNYESTE